MVKSAVLGYPRVGVNRSAKKAIESYWAGNSSAEQLQETAKNIRKERWESIKNAGVDVIPSGDFTLYDHLLDHSFNFGVIPQRYVEQKLSPLDTYFAMGRGRQDRAKGIDVVASEMGKFFDSNYHIVKVDHSPSTEFSLKNNQQLNEYKEAKELGITTRPVLFGPITYLSLVRAGRDAPADFEPISLLDKLIPVYKELLTQLKEAGVEEVQIDEPILVLDKAEQQGDLFKKTYEALAPVAPKITITTAYGRVGKSIEFLKDLPIHALHLDLDREPKQLDEVLAALKPTQIAIELGVVSGRNIWKNDLKASKALADKAIAELGADKVTVSTSSSLLHTPISIKVETKLTPQQVSWLSFATEKCEEVATLAGALNGKESEAFEQNSKDIAARREFERTSDSAVRDRVAAITEEQLKRKSPFPARREAQKKHLNLPKFPTTTIGSFPQTKEIRVARAKFTKGELSKEDYEKAMEKEVGSVVEFQEKVGLDLLVHGEPERNDMVQYFGEQLNGFIFTQLGWVQSYGSRYVRPPIVVSDVSRPSPMTVRWSSYAQSLTKLPMKGMLTGPVTILNWSFPRADVTKEVQSKQLALALRDEVVDLANAGIKAIQVDEPAIREGLPLRKADWDNYLTWAVDSFRLSTSGVEDDIQVHSHFCYSDFGDIFPSIQRLDADVISIEASKADLKLLDVFKSYGYSNEIGPGVYDIHSPRVPSEQEIKDRIASMVNVLPADLMVVNPDCGLKTRGWKETEESLANLVAAAKWARETYA
ncbi:5-methyltetrahydropteroyltriglutamate-homocysteine S-methyltransferase [Kwoniella mangroviensis CBS 8886]|uniref:5-methyltetrahydropteroyltriglutamate- homocysteine S-methyltransferase n=1 Tax=Kwoniella mangroviensis CBS 8507 TaxID=1296122 RepID=UPI00080D5BE0|nr:5-methyltetrahydropteroyltriglutamate-homocysteine S-methyltransferase [Kwoniella mangroviensis CBS 8507]OCF69863.1 5-methyltetrahydropteroyltriglutamate-homocysteine S-methyltransferase [Kwoniella mangroviensis CBS 8507]OCF71283.1 5-methyltetrahydropteroyltriglutamate-homocysteine S-methyltransferase [Kwoniella mangroviensis CBS 8886]